MRRLRLPYNEQYLRRDEDACYPKFKIHGAAPENPATISTEKFVKGEPP
jgi:hypothetical protein